MRWFCQMLFPRWCILADPHDIHFGDRAEAEGASMSMGIPYMTNSWISSDQEVIYLKLIDPEVTPPSSQKYPRMLHILQTVSHVRGVRVRICLSARSAARFALSLFAR